jgi:hypothetical protein
VRRTAALCKSKLAEIVLKQLYKKHAQQQESAGAVCAAGW